MIRRAAWLLLMFAASAAFGHEPSRSLVTLDATGETLHGRWDISLRDLEDAVGLDADGDSAVSWGEVVARRDKIVAYALPRLRVTADSLACTLGGDLKGVDEHGGATFAVLELTSRCAPPRQLGLDYGLLFELDRMHRAIVGVRSAAGASSAVVSADSPTLTLELEALSPWSTLARFVAEGVRHILEGYDHLAFVSLLLLPIVLGRGREPYASARCIAGEILRVVTAFTVAHSLTLALAASGYVPIPTRLVELAIAASVLLAALLNLVPNAPRIGGKLAFGFGLVHGFGFANALGDLTGGDTALLASLAGFNVGVELGQLAVVALVLALTTIAKRVSLDLDQLAVVAALMPLLFLARRFTVSRLVFNTLGSSACGALAVVWLAERLN
jgi:HupE / UreJ protein